MSVEPKTSTAKVEVESVTADSRSDGAKSESEDVTATTSTCTRTNTRQNHGHGLHLVRHQPRTFFEGPRDIQRHSKIPMFIRLYGGILPNMVIPLLFVGTWATAITLIRKYVADIGVDTVLLTVLGFVVAFAVNFRSNTAYERYSEGRKYWAVLILACRNLGRQLWIHMAEREDEADPLRPKKDLVGKITAMNLIASFPVALKHHLRFEPALDYLDYDHLIAPITKTTMCNKIDQSTLRTRKKPAMKRIGTYLGVSFLFSNPRKILKRSEDNLGNLPHEILTHITAYFENAMASKHIFGPNKFFWSDVRTMAEVLTGTERIVNTPLPLAYTISIAQITWMYIMVLPFQLINKLSWVTIPATMLAAYIILGLAMIGEEIENPFGYDVNDLPLDQYCDEIRDDLAILMGHTLAEYSVYNDDENNQPLLPHSANNAAEWLKHDMSEMRALLKQKAMEAHTKKRQVTHALEV